MHPLRRGARLGLGLAFALGFFLRDFMEPESRVRDELAGVYKRLQSMLGAGTKKAEPESGEDD